MTLAVGPKSNKTNKQTLFAKSNYDVFQSLKIVFILKDIANPDEVQYSGSSLFANCLFVFTVQSTA